MAGRFALFYLLVCLFVAGCATIPESSQAPSIGPYRTISARLLVIEPTRRWQVMLDWQTDGPSSGRARLVHAASDTIVEVRWQKNSIELRDNRSPRWRRVSAAQLSEQGIVVTPYTLSQFLAGRLPSGFYKTGPDTWEARRDDTIIRVGWNPATHHLNLTDVRDGRQATLIILSGKKRDPATPAKNDHSA